MLGLRKLSILLLFFDCGAAFADDVVEHDQDLAVPSRPTWSVVGSLEGTQIDNAFFTPGDKQSDVYVAPDVTLRLSGYLTSEISYRIYARLEVDAFSDLTDANNSVARVGVRLARPLGEWTASLAYENRYAFDGIYEDRLFTGHDVITAIARDYECGIAIFSPGGLITYRHSDLAEANRYRLELWFGIEVPIDSKWSLVSEPFFESFWFTDGLNTGRRDQIYSASLGLKYNLSDNATLTTEAVYEGRSSNQSGRDYDVVEIGPRLDFAF